MQHVLVAAVPGAHDRISRALAGCDVAFVTSLLDTVAALRTHHFDAVIIGIEVDESRALDVLEAVRHANLTTPVVCVRARARTHQPATLLASFGLAAKSSGACAFIDLSDDNSYFGATLTVPSAVCQ